MEPNEMKNSFYSHNNVLNSQHALRRMRYRKRHYNRKTSARYHYA